MKGEEVGWCLAAVSTMLQRFTTGFVQTCELTLTEHWSVSLCVCAC